MAIPSLISATGVLMPRPVPTVRPVPNVATQPVPARQPESPVAPAVGRERDRNLMDGLGPIQRARVQVQEIAQRSRERAETETDENVATLAVDRLSQAERLLTRVRDLLDTARNDERAPEERDAAEREAREIVQVISVSPDDAQERTNATVLAAVAVEPEVLGLNDLARTAVEPGAGVGRIEAQAAVALDRVRAAREFLRQPFQPSPIRSFAEEQEEVSREERVRLESPAAAANVAREVRAQSRENSGELFTSLTNVLPQNVIALLVS